MKFQTLPVKRRPVPKGIFHRFHAVTRNRRQRVAAAATPSGDMEMDDHGPRISRSLFIIFMIHIVAIALIFIHQQFLQGRTTGEEATAATSPAANSTTAISQRGELPRLSNGEKPYIVRTGDNYARIAAAEGVDETDLRQANNEVDIRPGLILKIPPKRIVAEEPPEVAAIRERNSAVGNRGIVEDVDVSSAPRAVLVRPVGNHEAAASTPAGSGKFHVVQPGESIFRIANNFKVSQDSLMKLNGISDPRKLRAGMRLSIPAN
jgi:LysM repeat protein